MTTHRRDKKRGWSASDGGVLWIHFLLAIGLTLLLWCALCYLAAQRLSGADHHGLQDCPDGGEIADPAAAGWPLPSVCATEDCKVNYVRRLQSGGIAFPIPPIRHMIWKGELMPKHLVAKLLTWQRLHPDWTYVMWRDHDLEPFVAVNFPGLLAKYKSLPAREMKTDMIRYMILYKFGGVYADLDYGLVRSLDELRQFHAVVTREPDLHALQTFGAQWPPVIMGSPAFMMSAPGHAFFYHSLLQLGLREATAVQSYAGPVGLTDILQAYRTAKPSVRSAKDGVYVAPWRSFWSGQEIRLRHPGRVFLSGRVYAASLIRRCKSLLSAGPATGTGGGGGRGRGAVLSQFCAHLKSSADLSHAAEEPPIFATQDLIKAEPEYNTDTKSGRALYEKSLVNIRKLIPRLRFGADFVKIAM